MLRKEVINILHSSAIEPLIEQALTENNFFTRSSITYAIDAITEKLPHTQPHANNSRKIGVICAGNIPLVGLGDMYNGLLSAGELYLKPSRRDPMMRAFAPLCSVVEDLPQDIEVILAMGSDQTMQILEQKYPQAKLILRGSEHSAAVLSGNETDEDLHNLADDIFTHSSLGCRSVTHLHIPRHYEIEKLIFNIHNREFRQAWFNNYRQQKAISTMRDENFVDGGYYILKEGFSNVISTVGYTFYDKIDKIEYRSGSIKSIIADSSLEQFLPCRPTKFGYGQRPDFEFIEF